MRAILSLLCAVLLLLPVAAHAQSSHCIALAQDTPGITYLHRASYTDPVAPNSVRISYVGHASFMIQTEAGLSAITDYTGFTGLGENRDFVPDVATMNHAHDSHWTARPDPEITHILKGWGNGREPLLHRLELEELLIRNVPTDIRSRYSDGVEKFGNSIFIFETAGLCIGHLGHLHHEPDEAQFAALGRLDVVMAAVDGGMTLDLASMTRVLKRLKSSVVIPMHWFGRLNLDQFLAGMADDFAIERTGQNALTVSLRSLPDRPTIMVLEPGFEPSDN
jgi:L-ascorbate metabolism protein UlaG (beta-lactamase superfamily)